MGNSSGIIIQNRYWRRLALRLAVKLDLMLDDGRIVLVPSKRRPRAGWADAARRIAESGDDALVWPEFGNSDDCDLKW